MSSAKTAGQTSRSRRGVRRQARSWFRKAAANPVASFLLPALLAVVGRLLLLTEVPPPKPFISDEFSYLLAGETFASFRLTNAPHALWQHFETLHELVQPTYMSKYPPAQGFALAIGFWLFGRPWYGVLLSMATFCGLLPWAFRAWIPATWALVGALLAAFKIGILSYWTDTYWGGGCAAIGGALFLGALMRLARNPTPGMAAVFTLGFGILANSRPEGTVVMIVGGGGFLLWKWFGGGRWKTAWPAYPLRTIPAAVAVALPILLFMAYYDYRVTGDVLTLPYRGYDRNYAIWTAFIWQQAPSPTPIYHHAFLHDYWINRDAGIKLMQRDHWFMSHWVGYQSVIQFYFGNVFFPGLLLLVPAFAFGRKFRAMFALLAFFVAASGLIVEIFPHYTAPAAALIYLCATAAMRAAWHLTPFAFPLGKIAVLALLAYFLISTSLLRTSLHNRYLFFWPELAIKRDGVVAALKNQPGRQLVFIDYGPRHYLDDVWTFNHADIDDSPIIWVNSMSRAENQEVLDYYAPQNRTAWLLEENRDVELRPYGDAKAPPIYEYHLPAAHLPAPK